MDIETIREYCLSKPATEESFPFDEVTLVFKVKGKMFALLPLDNPGSINLKCDPEYALQLREKYHEVQPGYHMSKKHWNTVNFNGGLPGKLILEWVDHSYSQVVKGLKKADREEIERFF